MAVSAWAAAMHDPYMIFEKPKSATVKIFRETAPCIKFEKPKCTAVRFSAERPQCTKFEKPECMAS